MLLCPLPRHSTLLLALGVGCPVDLALFCFFLFVTLASSYFCPLASFLPLLVDSLSLSFLLFSCPPANSTCHSSSHLTVGLMSLLDVGAESHGAIRSVRGHRDPVCEAADIAHCLND